MATSFNWKNIYTPWKGMRPRSQRTLAASKPGALFLGSLQRDKAVERFVLENESLRHPGIDTDGGSFQDALDRG